MLSLDSKDLLKYTDDQARFVKRFLGDKNTLLDSTFVLPPNDCNEFWVTLTSTPPLANAYFFGLINYIRDKLRLGYSKHAFRIKKAMNTLLVVAHYIK